MLTKKEIISILIAVVIFGFVTSFSENITSFQKNFPLMLLFGLITISIYTLGKKAMAYRFDSENEIKIWSFKRYGLYERSHFKNPIPVGIILPFLLSVLSLGRIPWLAILQSEEKSLSTKAVRRHDFYSFSELTDWQIGLISASGILACLAFSVIAYFINLPELARLNVYYAAFNLIPLGKLDGTKIFFGSKGVLWIALASLCLIIIVWFKIFIF